MFTVPWRFFHKTLAHKIPETLDWSEVGPAAFFLKKKKRACCLTPPPFFVLVYLFLVALGLPCCLGFSLAVACGLLTAVASLAAVHGVQGVRVSGVAAHGLSSFGSWALEHRLSSCTA